MKVKNNFNCRPTIIGSLPYTDAELACDKVISFLRDFPAWPQLPRRTNLENMYIQFSEGFPGVDIAGSIISVDPDSAHAGLEKLYDRFARSDTSGLAVTHDYALGLHTLVNRGKLQATGLKGQVIGPISWGLCVTDGTGRGILYDESLADALAKFLFLKAAWQENLLRTVSQNTIIFIDEPYLASLGSAFVAISDSQVSDLLKEVLAGIRGIRGIHCCGGTNWKLLLELPINVLSFDAYNYADSLACYQQEVINFIRDAGSIAWGIVPNNEEALTKETAASLLDRLGEAMAPYTRNGIPFREVIASSLITPTCGLDSLTLDASEEVLKLLNDLAERINRKYGA